MLNERVDLEELEYLMEFCSLDFFVSKLIELKMEFQIRYWIMGDLVKTFLRIAPNRQKIFLEVAPLTLLDLEQLDMCGVLVEPQIAAIIEQQLTSKKGHPKWKTAPKRKKFLRKSTEWLRHSYAGM